MKRLIAVSTLAGALWLLVLYNTRYDTASVALNAESRAMP